MEAEKKQWIKTEIRIILFSEKDMLTESGNSEIDLPEVPRK